MDSNTVQHQKRLGLYCSAFDYFEVSLHAATADGSRHREELIESLVQCFDGGTCPAVRPVRHPGPSFLNFLDDDDSQIEIALYFHPMPDQRTPAFRPDDSPVIQLLLLDEATPRPEIQSELSVIGPSITGSLTADFFAELLLSGIMQKRTICQGLEEFAWFFHPEPGHEIAWAWIEHQSGPGVTSEQVSRSFETIDPSSIDLALCIGFWEEPCADIASTSAALEAAFNSVPEHALVAFTDAALLPAWSSRIGSCPNGGTLMALRFAKGTQ